MRDPTRLDRDHSALLIVDIQERLAPHVEHGDAIAARALALRSAAACLSVPAFLTEHCANRLGPVVPALRERFEGSQIFGKTCFGALDHPEFDTLLRACGRTQIVVAGMEAHVCVMQTVLGLVSHGYAPFVVGDAVGSRPARCIDRELALSRMHDAGATIVGTETALFEWTRAGDDPAFRDILSLVKALDTES